MAFRTPRFPASARRLAPAALAAAAVAAAAPARVARAQPAAPAARHAAPARGAGADMPGPFWLSLLTSVAAGVAGAAAAGRLGGARLATAAGWALENLVVGSVGAVALLGLNPPGGTWPALAATAAAGGIAGQALLVANANARRALGAELARDAAVEGVRRVAILAGEQMETLRRLAVDGGGMIGSGTLVDASRARTLEVYAERARLELLRVARRAPPPPARRAPPDPEEATAG